MRIEKIKSAREIFALMRALDSDSFVASLALKSFSKQEVERQYHMKIVGRWINEGGVMFRNRHGHLAVVNPHNEIGARYIAWRRRKASMN